MRITYSPANHIFNDSIVIEIASFIFGKFFANHNTNERVRMINNISISIRVAALL